MDCPNPTEPGLLLPKLVNRYKKPIYPIITILYFMKKFVEMVLGHTCNYCHLA
jgi:hypothetical protein